MGRIPHRPFFCILGLCLLILPVCGGCPFLASKTTPATIPQVDGYWLVADMSQDDQTNEDVNDDETDAEFWKLQKTTERQDSYDFTLSDPCHPDIVLGNGTAYSTGDVAITIGEDAGYFVGRFQGGHEIESYDWTDEDSRPIAYHIGPVNCGVEEGDEDPHVLVQSITYIEDDEETLADKLLRVEKSGADHLALARGQGLPLGDDKSIAGAKSADNCANSSGTVIPCPATGAGTPGYVDCTTQTMSESRQRTLLDTVLLIDTDAIYPGALLQGGTFAAGTFAPITIPRAAGKITLGGIVTSSGKYSRTVSEVSYASIRDEIADMLEKEPIIATAADATFEMTQAYSANQFAFSLGVNGSYMSANLSSKLNIDNQSKENLLVARFTQVFYSVSFEPPSTPSAVFRDGANFVDPDDQIAVPDPQTGQVNPPLYVSNVKYGRQVFLIARSSYGAKYVEAALQAAWSGFGASVEVTSGLTNKDVMSKTQISYIVRGGESGLALAPLAVATPAEMYDKVRELLVAREAATFSAANPGVPIGYTLRYLTNNRPAMISYSTVYDRHDCRTVPAQDFNYQVHVVGPNYRARLYVDNKLFAGPLQSGDTYIGVNNYLKDNNDHELKLELSNGDCGSAGIFWEVLVDGAVRWQQRWSQSTWQGFKRGNICGYVNDKWFRINRSTGKVELIRSD